LGVEPGSEKAEMKIDIDKLTESELIDLNNRIVQRLRFLQQMRAHSAMLEFSVGERVCFHPEGRDVIYGVLTRYNKKTVTVITESGEHWNVSPSALRKASAEAKPVGSNNVVPLNRK
jgi:hypothetical protein